MYIAYLYFSLFSWYYYYFFFLSFLVYKRHEYCITNLYISTAVAKKKKKVIIIIKKYEYIYNDAFKEQKILYY